MGLQLVGGKKLKENMLRQSGEAALYETVLLCAQIREKNRNECKAKNILTEIGHIKH